MTVAAVLTGCAVSTAGQAAPTPGDGPDTSTATTTSSDEPDSGELPTDGAPKVDNPLDTAKFQKDPCLTLTAEQSDRLLKLPSGRPYDAALGNACEWKNETTGGRVDVRFIDRQQNGLSAQYAANNRGQWVFFDELTVEGYPAVARGIADRRDIGICTVVVGASDEIAYEVVLEQSEAKVGSKDPCSVAADVAADTITTIKAG